MANNIYQDRVINNIKYAIQESKSASEIDHPGLTGKIRELTASKLIEPMLPKGFEVGNGKISDKNGNLSKETDLIIYNSSILPPIMYSETEGVFPIEACFFAIEVKSKLTASNLKDSISKAKEILDFNYHVGKGSLEDDRKFIEVPVIPCLFAYSSDLKGDPTKEIERYSKYDSDWKRNAVLRMITVANKGHYFYNFEKQKWACFPHTPKYDEVLRFISGITDTLTKQKNKFRKSLLGPYIKATDENAIVIG